MSHPARYLLLRSRALARGRSLGGKHEVAGACSERRRRTSLTSERWWSPVSVARSQVEFACYMFQDNLDCGAYGGRDRDLGGSLGQVPCCCQRRVRVILGLFWWWWYLMAGNRRIALF